MTSINSFMNKSITAVCKTNVSLEILTARVAKKEIDRIMRPGQQGGLPATHTQF